MGQQLLAVRMAGTPLLSFRMQRILAINRPSLLRSTEIPLSWLHSRGESYNRSMKVRKKWEEEWVAAWAL